VSRTLKLNPLLLGMLFFPLTFSSYISMLPVAGVSGTLSDVSLSYCLLFLRMCDQLFSPATALTPLQRFVNTSAQGIVHAKTGRV
jgi:D-alanyl-D-alanine carboxypeptidase